MGTTVDEKSIMMITILQLLLPEKNLKRDILKKNNQSG